MKNEIYLLGDAYLDGTITSETTHKGHFIFNLEHPITHSNKPAINKIVLKTEKFFANRSFGKLPLCVSLANNHILDYGEQGLNDTISVLKEHNVKYFGAGPLGKNFNNPLIIQIKGKTVAFLGYCYKKYFRENNLNPLKANLAPLDFELIESDINNIRRSVDRIIVSLHWGKEEAILPTPEQREIGWKLSEIGADIIMGHHPHTVQPLEIIGNCIISYSLGNHIFPDLDIPSYYNANNEPQRLFKKKQAVWNRSSICLVYDLNFGSYQIIPFLQQNNRIIKKTTLYHKAIYISLKRKNYSNFRKRVERCSLAFQMLYRSNWHKSPRLPKYSSIKKLFQTN